MWYKVKSTRSIYKHIGDADYTKHTIKADIVDIVDIAEFTCQSAIASVVIFTIYIAHTSIIPAA